MNGAIIAAKNEADTIGGIVLSLLKQGLSVFVIDDGSTDGTGDIASKMGANVHRNEVSKGIRESLMIGWEYAINAGWAYTVQIDAGGSHDPLAAGELIGRCDGISIGSRFIAGARYTGRKWRATASRITAWLLNFATHRKITDWTSGYRVFSRKSLMSLSKVNYLTKMHTWQIEVLGEAVHRKMEITEVPISYTAGDSSLRLNVIPDLITVYLWIFNR